MPVLNSNPVTNDTSNCTTENPKLGKTCEDAGSGVAEQSVAHHVAPTISIVVTQPEEIKNAESPKKSAQLSDDGDRDLCRVCQQPSEEPLVDLGCRCRGDLSKTHRSCIDVWFRTRGSNKCEICQLILLISYFVLVEQTSYWIWRVDSRYGGREVNERRWMSPLWVAFAILIGGLLLDVLISVSLGVSALPVNIIIGVLIVLGLGTAIRLGLECCHELGTRTTVQRVDFNISPGYPAAASVAV
ncbi:E3 ubiquitin-protein ligase MARCH3 [Carex littledalei]|uniref:E3 ubiquitin-protein ligase MARCH3 n=1 Tax=Carex littledalei TaxID=544730 RepID=A0A833QST8_9POAL|nr:E3 ubiquitin-protein ligase MARCH3 [Carex littledalei]